MRSLIGLLLLLVFISGCSGYSVIIKDAVFEDVNISSSLHIAKLNVLNKEKIDGDCWIVLEIVQYNMTLNRTNKSLGVIKAKESVLTNFTFVMPNGTSDIKIIANCSYE